MDSGYYVFISYAHQDSNVHRVAAFEQYLHQCLPGKIKLLLDRKYLGTGKNIPHYMNFLDTCPVTIMLLTPEYKRRTENATGGVFAEYDKIRSRHLAEDDDILVLPILFEGTAATAIPTLFESELYADFLQFQPRKANSEDGKYYLSEKPLGIFIPRFQEIARQIESRITVRSSLTQVDYQTQLENLFANTKVTRKWVRLHPEFVHHLFVPTRSYERVKNQQALFMIGRKGSGKSTVANTLPELEHERYKTCIPILAENINLKATLALVDHQTLENLLVSLRGRLGGSATEYTQLNPPQMLFKYAWYGLIYICLANELCELAKHDQLNENQKRYSDALRREFARFTYHQSQHVQASTYYTAATQAFVEFWSERVTGALKMPRLSDVVRHLDSNVNPEAFLKYMFSDDFLTSIRNIVNACDRRALVTLDEFDSVFSMFRQGIRISAKASSHSSTSPTMESEWIQALMLLILELKGYRRGWHDSVFDRLDFCITIPRDSYAQVLHVDRDAYFQLEKTAGLDWTGVYLAKMLARRLCFMHNDDFDETADVFQELQRVTRTNLAKVPPTIAFDFNGRRIVIDLFCYVLRHTFWRPRDVLTYYAALMAAATSFTEERVLTVEQVRRVIANTTKNIIETEFIGEFKDVLTNLPRILDQFREAPQVMDYSALVTRLRDVDFAHPQRIVTEILEKLRILYEIGFLGIELTNEVMEIESLTTQQCFDFNEGSRIFDSMAAYSFKECRFLIHPIFVERLHLRYGQNDFILYWDDKYLTNNHVVRLSVLDSI